MKGILGMLCSNDEDKERIYICTFLNNKSLIVTGRLIEEKEGNKIK